MVGALHGREHSSTGSILLNGEHSADGSTDDGSTITSVKQGSLCQGGSTVCPMGSITSVRTE